MSVLANYEPKSVFSYFEKLCTIPRGSGNTDGIASYLISLLKSTDWRATGMRQIM